jgi:hypothetical protein
VSPSEYRQQLLNMLGYFWTNVFLDSSFVDAYVSSVAVPFGRLDSEVAKLSSYTSRSAVPLKELAEARLYVFDERLEDTNAHRYGEGLTYGGGSLYGELRATSDYRRFRIDPALQPEFLTVGFESPSVIWQRGQDYEVESEGWLVFFKDPTALAGLLSHPVAVVDSGVLLQFIMWGWQSEEDLQAVSTFFGTMAGVTGDTSAKLKNAVNIAWDLRVEGATVRNVKRLLAALTDTDFAESAGTVQKVFLEGDRRCVLTDNAVYTAPLQALELSKIVPGYVLAAGEEIFDTYALHTGNEEILFEDFEGLALGEGHLPFLKADILIPNALEEVTREHRDSWYEVVAE